MIFLGGSCNPTTWRQTVAIPYLELQGISYYNPQVDNWTPDVVDLEKRAKRNAQVLLFVIDKQTRSTVSLVESAFMAGYGRKLVLVIHPFECTIIRNPNREYSYTTTNILQKTDCKYEASSRTVNRCDTESTTSAKKSSSSSIVASSTVISASTKQKSSCLNSVSSSVSVTSAEVNSFMESEEKGNGEKLYEKTYQEAKQTSSNLIRINGEDISLIELLELEQARLMLQALAKARNIPLFSDIDQALKYISTSITSFDEATTSHPLEPVNESNQQRMTHFPGRPADDQRASGRYSTIDSWSTRHVDHSNQDRVGNEDSGTVKDIYLSLDSDDQSDTKSRVIPLLKERGLKYNFLYINDTKDIGSMDLPSSRGTLDLAGCLVESGKCVERTRLLSSTAPPPPSLATSTSAAAAAATTTTTDDPVRRRLAIGASDSFPQEYVEIVKDTCAVRSCRIFLFVITNRCRGLPIMVLASHFMALFQQNVVLCIQHLEEPCTIAGETLSSSAIADYNRSRIYLKDYAMEFKVPIFTSIREAIDCCSHKCTYIEPATTIK